MTCPLRAVTCRSRRSRLRQQRTGPAAVKLLRYRLQLTVYKIRSLETNGWAAIHHGQEVTRPIETFGAGLWNTGGEAGSSAISGAADQPNW